MDVVAHAGPVSCWVVGAEQLEWRTLAECGLDGQRDEVRLWMVCFAEGSVEHGACCIEVPQTCDLETFSLPTQREKALDHGFGFAVGAHGRERKLFGQRQGGGRAVDRAGRREHHSTNTRIEHFLHKTDGTAHIDVEIMAGLVHTIAHHGLGSEVQHRVELLRTKYVSKKRSVANVPLDKPSRDGCTMPGGQIVHGHHMVPFV